MKATFEELKGKSLLGLKAEVGGDDVVFHCSDGESFRLWHDQECCESVYLSDVVGDISDILGLPILLAEESVSRDMAGPMVCDSCTWTFYRIATAKGFLTLRFIGDSNGYYSERVDFQKMEPAE